MSEDPFEDEIRRGLEDVDAGRILSFEEVFPESIKDDLRQAIEVALAELEGLKEANLDKYQRENLNAAVKVLAEAADAWTGHDVPMQDDDSA